MLKYFLLALIFFSTASAYASEKAPKQLALEYLRITNMEDVVNASLNEYDAQLSKNMLPEQHTQIREMLDKSLGWNATKDQLGDLVSNLYTTSELKAFIAFVKTPAGRSYNAKNEDFSKLYSEFASKNLQLVLKECCSKPSDQGR